jgi:hypothetical protein
MTNCLRTAVSCIFILAASLSFSDWEGWEAVQQKFRSETDFDRKIQYLKTDKEDILEFVSDSMRGDVESFEGTMTQVQKQKLIEKIDAQLDSFVVAERQDKIDAADSQIRTIKQNDLYNKSKELKEATWLQKVLERLRNLTRIETPETPDFKMPRWLASVIKFVFNILILVAIGLLIWLVSKVRFGKKIKSVRTKGLLEEGEELLSEDEYLSKADGLAAEGRFREACRCLYLAILLRISSARIARFEPSETNWEHLRRIHSSSKRPAGMDVRPITKLFDLIWYGDGFTGEPQYQEFKSTYARIKELTLETKSA